MARVPGVSNSVEGLDNKFSTDVLWNMISLAFLAIAGLALNLVIGRYYGAATLGLFNIAFALYIFTSQFAVFGLHMSVLRYVSEHRERDGDEIDRAISYGLWCVICTTSIVSLFAWLATPLLPLVFSINNIETAWLVLLPGLWCFSLNKFLLAIVNGARHMRAFAILQSLRFIFIFVALFSLILQSYEGYYLTAVISFAEILLLPILLVYVIYTGKIVRRWRFNIRSPWINKHLDFGRRVFLAGTVSELNTRVDILMIGAFLGDVKAGIYSIAILLVEGLAQAITVVRNNVNPLLTRYILDGSKEEFTHFSRKVSTYFFLFMVFSGAVLIGIFPYAAAVIFPGKQFDAAFVPMIVLTAGLVLASSHMPFNMILSQSGKPFVHTAYVAAILVCNALLNLIAIPTAGITGAAFATALSYLFSVGLLIVLMRRQLNAKIWL